jgi:protein-ribulosamine 3-kinase
VNTLPPSVAEQLEREVGRPLRTALVGGGCIANASRLQTASGVYFLKWADGEAGAAFEAEAAGLRALRDAGSPLVVPEVVSVSNAGGHQPGFLLMEWVEPSGRLEGSAFGAGLAALHRHTEPGGRYGFGRDNFIGRLPQRNAWNERWPVFFREERLVPQFEMARERRRWRSGWNAPAERLLARLDDLLPASPPASILHGDLWSGNVVATTGGRAALVDPAAYYGHAETDLAMMTLFGGFEAAVFDAYFAAVPREAGYEDRQAVYQLYHVVNHLNHFGEGYAGQVNRMLRRLG